MGKKKAVYTDTTARPVRKNRFEVLASDSEEEESSSVSSPQPAPPSKETVEQQPSSIEEIRNRWAVGQASTEFPNFFSRGLRHVPVSPPTTWDVPMFLDEERFPSSEGSPSVFPVLSIPKQTEPYVKGGAEGNGRFTLSTPRAGAEEASFSEEKEEKTFAMRIKESLDAVEKEKHAQNLEKNHTNRVEAIRSSLTQLSFFRKGVV